MAKADDSNCYLRSRFGRRSSSPNGIAFVAAQESFLGEDALSSGMVGVESHVVQVRVTHAQQAIKELRPALAVRVGQFAVHELVEGLMADLPGAIENIERDPDGEDRIQAPAFQY